jgi:predicted dinucleotide-binding enzyme
VAGFIESIGYSVVDAGSLGDSWRQATGTPVWGTAPPTRPRTSNFICADISSWLAKTNN